MLSHYVLIRRDLRPGLQLAYTTHAAGESVSGPVPSGARAIVLGVSDEGTLRVYDQALRGIEHTMIVEDGEAFSIGITPTAEIERVRRVLSALPLAG